MKDFDIKEWLLGVWARMKVLPWKRIGLISLCVFLALVLVALIVATVYIEYLFGLIDHTDNNETLPSELITMPTLPPDSVPTFPTSSNEKGVIIAHKDIVNIMLVGQDRRPGQNHRTLSDVMILCTFNKKDQTITMTSFMRDTYVTIPGIGDTKMNQAYFQGGTELLSETMMENFNVKVDAFVEVDFSGFKQIVNALGGVDMYLTAAEANYMNTTPWDGLDSDGWALREGVNHLNGDMALAYSRIRAIGDDFGRTERQRKVLSAILEGCKSMSLTQAMSMLNQLLPMVATDMTTSQITGYAMELFPMLSDSKIVTQRIPADGTYTLTREFVIPDLELNRQFLVDTLMPD